MDHVFSLLTMTIPFKGSQKYNFPVCSGWICGTVAPQVIQPPDRRIANPAGAEIILYGL